MGTAVTDEEDRGDKSPPGRAEHVGTAGPSTPKPGRVPATQLGPVLEQRVNEGQNAPNPACHFLRVLRCHPAVTGTPDEV